MYAERCMVCGYAPTTDESPIGHEVWKNHHPNQGLFISCPGSVSCQSVGSPSSMQFLGSFYILSPWRARAKNVEGTKRPYRLPSTSWGRRHITLMVSVNISLTPIPFACRGPPIPFFFPCSQPQPTRNPSTTLYLCPPSGSVPLGPVCFPARGTGGGTLMRCSGHREMCHNLPAQGPGEIAVFTF